MITATLLLIIGSATATHSGSISHYADTSELLGIVTLWPRENVLVFNNHLVCFDWPMLASIEGWTRTQVVVKDVFGTYATIGVQKVPRQPSRQFDQEMPISRARGVIEKGDIVAEERFPGAGPDAFYTRLLGIGPTDSLDRFFKCSYDTRRNVTVVDQDTSRSDPLRLEVSGYSIPVFIRNRDTYIYIQEGNTRFGPLTLSSHGRKKVLIGNAQGFLPLRTRRK